MRYRLLPFLMLFGALCFSTHYSAQSADSDQDGVLDIDDLDSDNDGIFDYDERACITVDASDAEAVFAFNSVSGWGPEAAIGSDNQRARLNAVDDFLILDLGTIIPGGSRISIEARTRRSFHTLQVAESQDGESFMAPSILSFNFLGSDQIFFATVDFDTRYISLKMANDAGEGAIEIDNVSQLGRTDCFVVDTDGDGLENRFDLDSDGDGCFDVIEAGYSDENLDGRLDGTGVDTQGLVTGFASGYANMHPAVVTQAFGNCLIQDVTYVKVNTSQDSNDIEPGDGVCADANGDCSLRAAVQEANASSGYTVIRFDIKEDLVLEAALPPIYTNIVIDGTSAPAYYKDHVGPKILTNGFNALYLAEADRSVIKGMNLSGPSSTELSGFGLVMAHCDEVEVRDNIFSNRTRGVHANNSCGLIIEGNDLRDAGASASHGAVYLQNTCLGEAEIDLLMSDNQFGETTASGTCAIQLVNARGISISDGTVEGTHIELTEPLGVGYPIRTINAEGLSIENVDFSAVGDKNGIGLWMEGSSNASIQNISLRDRDVAVKLVGGQTITINGADMTGSGVNDDQAVILIENLVVTDSEDLQISDIQVDNDAFTVVNLIACDGLVISGTDALLPNIRLDEAEFVGRSTIRVQDSDNITITDLRFKREDQLVGTEGIIIEDWSQNALVENCYFEGFASGLNLAETNGARVYCNTMAANANGIWVFYESDISDMSNNSFLCNAIGINNYTSNFVTSESDYWGDAQGSSSYAGFGDYFLGNVDASAWLEEAPDCAQEVDAALCSPEICDNGIDDDGDGQIDCDDGSCLDFPDCGGNIEGEDGFALLSSDRGPEMHVFPNPTNEAINIELAGLAESLRLRDPDGRNIRHEAMVPQGLTRWSLAGLEPGVYILEAITFGQRSTVRIVKY